MSPFRFVCSECGNELLIIEDLKFLKVYNPERTGRLELAIKRKLGEMKCPQCGHKLQIPPIKVEVTPYIKEK